MLRTGRFAAVTLLAAGLLAACGKGTPITSNSPTPSPTATPGVVNEVAISVPNSQPLGITPYGTSYFYITENRASQIGVLSGTGSGITITSTPTPTQNAGPNGVVSGPNGLIWFAETAIARIGQIQTSTSGFTEFQLGNKNAKPTELTLGSDGNIWATDPGTDSIWKIDQVGAASQFPVASGSKPLGITNGPDGALWFTEPGRNRIGRLTVDGTNYTEYAVATHNAGLSQIIEGSDNALWFTEQLAVKLGRIQVGGQVTNEYPLTPAKSADGLVQGEDGNFYFTDPTGSAIGQFFTTSQVVKTYPTKTANAKPTSLTVGLAAGNYLLYFTETSANKIGVFNY